MTSEPSAVATIGAALFDLLFVTAFFVFRKPEERRFLLPLGIAAFSLRAILVPLYYIALVEAGLEGYAYIDSYNYHLDGIEVAREFTEGLGHNSRAWVAVDPGYPVLTGIVYWIVGPNTLVVRMLNGVFGAIMLLYVYRLGRLVFEDAKIARWACYLVAFLPYSITIAINHRKDPLVALLVTFIVYHALCLLRFEKNWAGAAVSVVAGLAAISLFRSGFVLPFIGILFICYVLTQRSLIQAIALSVPTILIMVAIQLLISEEASITLAASTERLQAKLAGSADLSQAAGLVRLVRMTSFFEIYKLPIAAMLVVIFPFPPYVSGDLPPVILSWTNLLNLMFLPHMIAGAWMTVNRTDWRRCIPLLLFPAIFIILIGATHVGTVRYRETVFPLMLILAGAGLVRGGNFILSAFTYVGLILLGAVVLLFRHA